MNVQNIDQSGNTHWAQDINGEQISGIFAQEIKEIYAPSLDPYTSIPNTQAHITLGAVSDHTTAFETLDNESFTTGLAGNEMMAFYLDNGSGFTAFNSNGTIKEDVDTATDGTKWMTFGYSPGADAVWGDGTGSALADNTGYAYSHVNYGTGVTPDNFTGESWAAMDNIYNSTSWIFPGELNDPDESEMDFYIPDLANDIFLSSELEGNDNFKNGFSPWVFASNDPMALEVVPEPSTFMLLGIGLISIAGFVRKRKISV